MEEAKDDVNWNKNTKPMHVLQVGRAVAISALDMINANPWSRLPTSEHGCLEGVRNWVYRHIRSSKNTSFVAKRTTRTLAKTSR